MGKKENDELDEKLNTNSDTGGHDEILIDQLSEGLEIYQKQTKATFLSALSAGMEIGFSFLLVAICYSQLKGFINEDWIPYAAAFFYPLGFILVIIGKSILFTEQTSLLALPVMSGRRSFKELIKLWGIVIAGNILGGFIIGGMLLAIGQSLHVITVEGIDTIASHVTEYPTQIIFGSAILAGWLMGLLSWSLSSIKHAVGQIVVVYIITLIIGLGGFHHSIVGNIEIFTGMLTGSINFMDYLITLLMMLLGNTFGGVFFVAFLKYRTYTANLE
ncbi:formate/nitrite transporter family protein [Flagellimonas sp. 389]|uniref:formate/nitrite transporter family protein n=1 Tax=Flagellimonas sp. 389 TaxID=2835862 RepID=UPI001BD38FC9|nr:formate/nitrite transporter family protein [Flagellimonas sp. 389]MBS9464283.1 formate/nitrite transporter family protein [Flagellimonas sp. 389]